ncbi:hypothetical protein CCMA1212_001485 [Trichoderma ghanense]|uniref:Uncharacterized protein n=1 Tax=Trichoderma ghanense TaxID=65468 RepID=A0ABY2HDD0_9HYPO
MLTQVIDISYGSKERLQEILEEMLGEENFKLVQRISNQWQIKLIRRLTVVRYQIPYLIYCIMLLTRHKEEISVIQTNMRRHYLPTA